MILWRAALRNVLRHPWLTVLAVVGVSLGVAVVTAVDIANDAAQRSFLSAAETVAGKATHQIVGGPAGIPEDFYRTIRVGQHFRGCAPVVTGHLQLLVKGGMSFQMIGIDPFAEAPVRSFSSQYRRADVLNKLLTEPGTVLMLRETAAELGLRVGDRVTAEIGDGRRQLVLAGLIEAPDEVSRLGLASVLVADISTAQELFALGGRLSRIDLVISEGATGARVLQGIKSGLPAGVSVIPAGARAGALERMTRSFRLNLTALSLLALVVGMFLIYNTMTFSVIRRRRLIGMLRALGVSRREIFAMICSEALVIGVAGTAIGLAGGHLLGVQLTRLVARTINDLYFTMSVPTLPLLPAALLKGGLLGIAATVAAAVPSALEATGAPPRAVLSRSAIEARRRKSVPWAAAGGVFLMLCGLGLFQIHAGGVRLAFAGLFAVIVGYALLTPAAVMVAAAALRPVAAAVFGVVGRMAARGIVVSLSRTGVATAALVVAVSAGIGVGIMVGGFRLTVQSWLESWLQADVYLRSGDTGGRGLTPLDPALVRRLAALPDVKEYSLARRVNLEGAQGVTELLSMQLPKATFVRYPFKEGAPAKAWESFSWGESVIVSEPYSYRHHLRVGDRVTLTTGEGDRAFPISGIIYDYGSDTGIVFMSRAAYLRYFDDPSIDSMSFYARDGVSASDLARQIRSHAAGSAITVISNRDLKTATVAVFDRTFAITAVLRYLIMLVAFVGVLSALMAMQVERARELAVLRAVGVTPGQVWGVVCGETALIGLIAGVLSLPLGIMQALILIYVVNLRSFGWTMQLAIEPRYLVQAVLLSVSAALLAGVYPSLLMSRSLPALALTQEE
jgi:putative ABC transport system permease protein